VARISVSVNRNGPADHVVGRTEMQRAVARRLWGARSVHSPRLLSIARKSYSRWRFNAAQLLTAYASGGEVMNAVLVSWDWQGVNGVAEVLGYIRNQIHRVSDP
jgi:hypothetical protein